MNNVELPERNLGAQLLSELSKDEINNEKINRLLDQGAPLTHTDENGNTALHLAIMSVNGGTLPESTAIRIVKESGDVMNAKNKFGRTPLMTTGPYSVSIFKTLLDKGADINAKDIYGHSAVYSAIQFGHIQEAVELIRRGAKITLDEFEEIVSRARGDGLRQIREAIIMRNAGGRRRKTRKARKTHNNRKTRKYSHKKN